MGSWLLVGNNLGTPPKGVLGTTDNNALVFETNGKERLRVDTNGNVGIGTTTPSYPLHLPSGKTLRIEGGTNAADTTNYFSFGGNGTFGIDAPGVPNGRLVVLNNGKVGIGNASPATALHVQGASDQQSTLALGRSDNNKFARLGVGATGVTLEFDSTSYFSISNNAGIGIGATLSGTDLLHVTASGQVGVGTASPRSALEVDVAAPGALGPTLTLTNTGGGANAAVSIDLNASPPSASGAYNPFARLEALADANATSDIVFLTNNPSVPNNGLVERMRITCAPQTVTHITGAPWPITQSRVGIGTASPSAQLSVCGTGGENAGTAFSTTLRTSSGGLGALGAPNGDLALASFCCSVDNLNGLSLGIRAVRTAASPAGWPSTAICLGMDVDNTVRAGAALFLHASGNVGIGINTPTSKLHVAGDIAVTGDVLLTGADCAEDFDVAGDEPPEPGTVLVIDESGALRESEHAYDQKVAGVVSGADAYRHALVLDRRSGEAGRIPVALVGKVYCKVDAQFSPIGVGDLLTTSPTPGHAMKAVEPAKAFGSVMGKALGPLARGCGLIPILISLQ